MICTACGKKITIHGSANLRTSANIEQIVVEHTPDLYDFCFETHSRIIEAHKTINKPVRRTALWAAVLGEDKAGRDATPNTAAGLWKDNGMATGSSGFAKINAKTRDRIKRDGTVKQQRARTAAQSRTPTRAG
jgi:hypothetical protein